MRPSRDEGINTMLYNGRFPIMPCAVNEDGECFFKLLTSVCRDQTFFFFTLGASDDVICLGARCGLCADFIGG